MIAFRLVDQQPSINEGRKQDFQDSVPLDSLALSSSLYGQQLDDIRITFLDDHDIESHQPSRVLTFELDCTASFYYFRLLSFYVG